MKLGLASNFQDEIDNIEPIWDCFKNYVDQWLVVDSGSTDGTQEGLKELVGDRLILVEDDMIKREGYGYARTKLLELSEGMDWVLIIDGDERMFPEDTSKLKRVIDSSVNLIFLPRCHYQNWEATVVEYGSMTRTGNNWREAIAINPDWQPRLLRRVMENGRSMIRFRRRVHEVVYGYKTEMRRTDNPVIRHFGWMKPKERLDQIVALCNKLHAMPEYE